MHPYAYPTPATNDDDDNARWLTENGIPFDDEDERHQKSLTDCYSVITGVCNDDDD